MNDEMKQAIIDLWNLTRDREASANELSDRNASSRLDRHDLDGAFCLGKFEGIAETLGALGYELVTTDEDIAVDIIPGEGCQ